MKSKFTPKLVEKLEPNQIFVFGSNLLGNHMDGAANVAFYEFGAYWGVGEGFTGQTYALPTLDENYKRVTLDALYDSFVKFLKSVSSRQHREFIMTPVGCGIAGFNTNQVADTFWKAVNDNFSGVAFELRRIVLPEQFVRSEKERAIYDIWFQFRNVGKYNAELYQNSYLEAESQYNSFLENMC